MMRRAVILAATALAIARPAAALSQASGMSRAEAALAGPTRPYIDPGPAKARMTPATIIVRIMPAPEVRRLCPAAVDWHSLACTIMPARIVIMPDEESSGLSTALWLDLLRHELLHAMGLDFHGPRP